MSEEFTQSQFSLFTYLKLNVSLKDEILAETERSNPRQVGGHLQNWTGCDLMINKKRGES